MQTDLKSLLNNVAEVQLSYKSKVPASQRPQLRCSGDAHRVLLSVWDMDTIELQESFMILLMNRANRIIGVYKLSHGGITGTVTDVRLIFIAALKSAACSIILAHNHPSGNLTPSDADKSITKMIQEAGKLLEIKVLDHIILCSDGYYSFADEGII